MALIAGSTEEYGMGSSYHERDTSTRRCLKLVVLVLALLPAPRAWSAELHKETLAAWEQYARLTEARIEAELASDQGFLAYEFLSRVRKVLISDENQDYNLEKLNLEDHSWAEVIDLARTVPFLFSSKRVVVVELNRKKDETLNSTEKSILQDYLSSPSSQTVLIVIFRGKVSRKTSIVRFFASFPSSVVRLEEIKVLRGKPLLSWIEEKFNSEGKTITLDGKRRLVEIIGSDSRIHQRPRATGCPLQCVGQASHHSLEVLGGLDRSSSRNHDPGFGDVGAPRGFEVDAQPLDLTGQVRFRNRHGRHPSPVL